jgi:integrase
MAVEKYFIKSGAVRWRVRYRQPDGTRTCQRGFTTERSAKTYEAKVTVAKENNEFIAPALGKATVGSLAPGWLERKQKSSAPSHYRMLESAWRIHVQPRWGNTPLSAIDVLAVETWIASIPGGATTVKRVHGVLNGLLADAVKAKRLAVNPCREVDNLPRRKDKRHVYLTEDDVRRLANESGKHRALVLLMAYCGLRWGECVGLHVRDVEFLRRRIAVHTNAVQLGVDHAVGPPKGGGIRSVPVPEFILDELSVQCQDRGMDALVFGDGEHYQPRSKSHGGWFAGAVKRAKVQKISPHDLRHTCASLAVSAGANVLALSRMLGHQDPSVTLRVYADLFDDDLDGVAEALHGRHVSTRCPRGSVDSQ